jgi:hypothetical protein
MTFSSEVSERHFGFSIIADGVFLVIGTLFTKCRLGLRIHGAQRYSTRLISDSDEFFIHILTGN